MKETDFLKADRQPVSADRCDFGALNALLRGEIAAAETYEMALHKFADLPAACELEHIRNDHHAAVARLRERILRDGGDPPNSSGAWGAFAVTVAGTALALGAHSTLSALRQGEEHGVSEYEKTANSATITPECRHLIHDELLPLCRQHIARLQHLSDDQK